MVKVECSKCGTTFGEKRRRSKERIKETCRRTSLKIKF